MVCYEDVKRSFQEGSYECAIVPREASYATDHALLTVDVFLFVFRSWGLREEWDVDHRLHDYVTLKARLS